MVISRAVRRNKSITDNVIVETKNRKSTSTDRIIQFFMNNKGKYVRLDELLFGAGVTSGGHSSQILKSLIASKRIITTDCNCHKSKLYMMPL